jgi:hypothetical protein
MGALLTILLWAWALWPVALGFAAGLVAGWFLGMAQGKGEN